MLVLIARIPRSSAFQSTLCKGTGDGGENSSRLGGSGHGMVLCYVGNGWPKHFGQDYSLILRKEVLLVLIFD